MSLHHTAFGRSGLKLYNDLVEGDKIGFNNILTNVYGDSGTRWSKLLLDVQGYKKNKKNNDTTNGYAAVVIRDTLNSVLRDIFKA
jgi:hypothetical protein